ncbi:MAG: phage tail protein [Chloroflexota bacterium]|nr:phage tail protein [Chloroflexota bacterium]
MMPETAKPIEIYASFRFTVTMGKENEVLATFSECTLPNLEIETFEVKEGGQSEYSHRLPVRVRPGNVTLRYGLTKGDKLLHWYLAMLNGLDGEGKLIKDLSKAVTITMYNLEQGKMVAVANWTFKNAFPIKWKGPTLKTDQQALAIEELELAFHGFSANEI